MTVLVGTSGWHYKHWLDGVFYPPGLCSEELLPYYARQFSATEINSSFYRLPLEKTLESWRDSTPPDFVYLRMHGPDGAYEGSYSQEQLSEMVASIREWEQQRKGVYRFFDKDQEGYAAANARDLRQMLGAEIA